MNNFELNEKAIEISQSNTAYSLAKKLLLLEEEYGKLESEMTLSSLQVRHEVAQAMYPAVVAEVKMDQFVEYTKECIYFLSDMHTMPPEGTVEESQRLYANKPMFIFEKSQGV